MVKITNEKRLPATIRNPWLDSFYSPWIDMPWFKEMESAWSHVTENFDRLYDTFPSYMRQFPRDVSCDVVDKGDKYVLTADLPGIATDEVKVNVTGRQVEISAEHKDTREERSKEFVRNERSFLKYQRVLTVPEKIVDSGITANVNNGVLTVELPKKTSSSKKELPSQVKAA
ncbi:MAG: Hsp20/alpha crystallin family protein [Thaumarchaeota archaeon]|nr:Hsp20/alpha crystallin family protein [Nitrososphaerota archaeon]